MAIDNITLAAAKKYADQLALGGGAISGKNVVISKIEPIIGGNRITFTYILDDGTPKNSYLEVMNGEKGTSIISASIAENGLLTFTLSDGNIISAGIITIDENKINLKNYYTKYEVNEKFVQLLELDNLIQKHIENNITIVTYDDIKNLFEE